MGGKSSQSTQSVSIPPQVLAQYQTVVNQANQTAQTPFKSYGGEFVAPVNAQQNWGISNTDQYAQEAQPYFNKAAGTLGAAQSATEPYNEAAAYGTAASAAPLTGSQINQYLSPYLSDVMGSTAALQNQENQQAQAGQLGNAINSGAFGGDRTGIAAANLNQQEELANSNVLAGIANQGYQSALNTAQGEQQIGLAGAQQLANIGQTAYGEGANTASMYGSLGAGAQSAALQGAQAQIGAGTLEQQTQQAEDTALYNQFEQQQSYPYQVGAWLANISEGTGALQGSTTTTTQPGGFFSDDRLKHSKRPIGKTFDGQTIYAYQMHGDPRTRMGLIAQEVEKRHPKAVGVAEGYKFVDYGKATEKAANRGHFNDGGVVPFRLPRAAGGETDLDAILAAQQQMYSGLGGAKMRGINGLPRGGAANVPAPSGGSPQLITAQGGLQARPTGMQNAASLGQAARNYEGLYKDFGGTSPSTWFGGGSTTTTTTPGGLSPGVANAQADPSVSGSDLLPLDQQSYSQPAALVSSAADERRGGRIHRDAGGDTPYSDDGGLSIPDENPHNTLSKPAQLPPPSPTGFQQLMGSLGGGGGGGMGGLGSMFSGMGGSGGGDASGLISDAYSGGASDVGDGAIDVLSEAGARGGRMKRDDGGGAFDADSAPNSGSLGDAPDTSLAQAPALKQGAPNTSLDSVKHLALAAGEAYIGDYPGAAMQLYDTYNSAKSKRGGRIGKADAGAVTGDGGLADDPDLQPIQTTAQLIPTETLPEVESPSGGPGFGGTASDAPTYSNAGLGVVTAPTPDPATPKRVAVDSGTPLWDTLKTELAKPSNLIPIIAGIGAMGTAPTRSLGVALASGLSGAAASYVPTQQGLAQAQGQQIQNQIQGMNRDVLGAALKGQPGSGGAAAMPAVTPPTDVDPGVPASQLGDAYRAKLFVPPTPTPQEQQAMMQGNMLSKINPGIAQNAKLAFETRKQNQIAANTQFAQNTRDDAYKIASAADNGQRPFDTAAQVMPPLASQVVKDLGLPSDQSQWTPVQRAAADTAAQQYATSKVNALHPWTGDTYAEKDGTLYNSRTNQQPIGDASQVISPANMAQLIKDGNALDEVKMSDGSIQPMPHFKAVGVTGGQQFANARDWANSLLGGRSAPVGAPSPAGRPMPNGPRPMTPPSNSRQPLPAAPFTVDPTKMPPLVPGAPGPTLPGVDITKLPEIAAVPVRPGTPGITSSINMTKQADQVNKALDEASEQVAHAAEANALYDPFIKKLDSINPLDVGPGSQAYKGLLEMKAAINAAIGKGTPNDLVDVGVVDKFASQLGVQNVKGLIGAGQRITNQEMMTLLERASASNTQPVDVMKTIIAYQKANNDYDLLQGNTITAALKNGADPRGIDGSVESQYHRSDFVRQSMARTLTPPARMSQALAAVKQNPSLAAQFKDKYGFLPP